jgi:hypothetical protein
MQNYFVLLQLFCRGKKTSLEKKSFLEMTIIITILEIYEKITLLNISLKPQMFKKNSIINYPKLISITLKVFLALEKQLKWSLLEYFK